MLCERTRVLAKRQKLVGLSVGGRPAADDCPLDRIRLKNPHRFILMGTPEVLTAYGHSFVSWLPSFFLSRKQKHAGRTGGGGEALNHKV